MTRKNRDWDGVNWVAEWRAALEESLEQQTLLEKTILEERRAKWPDPLRALAQACQPAGEGGIRTIWDNIGEIKKDFYARSFAVYLGEMGEAKLSPEDERIVLRALNDLPPERAQSWDASTARINIISLAGARLSKQGLYRFGVVFFEEAQKWKPRGMFTPDALFWALRNLGDRELRGLLHDVEAKVADKEQTERVFGPLREADPENKEVEELMRAVNPWVFSGDPQLELLSRILCRMCHGGRAQTILETLEDRVRTQASARVGFTRPPSLDDVPEGTAPDDAPPFAPPGAYCTPSAPTPRDLQLLQEIVGGAEPQESGPPVTGAAISGGSWGERWGLGVSAAALFKGKVPEMGDAYEAALRSAWPEATGGAAKMRASGTPESKTPPDYTTAEIWEDIRNTAPGTSALEVVASRDPLGLYVQVAELAAQVRASASSPKAPQMLRLEAVLQDVRVFLRGRPRVAHRTTR